ncbi:Lrp/AsnC family transcriptional regulator [Enterococcus alishanensis]|uniref:Lrp/AsnC family transcriptional regulator n=1 Tax=Enterococcus alishanensis TaxID=1303817 RepID=A0ABS6THG4_9ENTE|nr:Lrp/AsnC family transcriptional regulator [Enterococcus alishanensis]MBV7392322.1 Lrp/AsnC family transcriptional regulator [Enterococcus alishanensis]
MDQLDQRIMNLLQVDGRLSIKKMAEKLFISGPAVSQRLRQLEEAGLIQQYQAQLNYAKNDLMIKAYVRLNLDPQDKTEFYPYIEKIPNILECDCVTGSYSILMKVIFCNTEELDHFVNQMQHFGPTNTQIVFSTPLASRGYQFEI